ncbi:hypothetical protein FZZ93_07435 [Halomonas eurihalina]|uniref:Uncharacterized protein n=1 Tax=Halomonas eurihalina TaxID=42566 RepID=A0A5D9D7X9_HALER|nr:hypothetical protein [Halomonas eurihalina]MDR5860704.1 hypothetical protein [Halomonas eurihalina]TZG40074.1 hypothetical protein FZZ93_07435 [Halomonas eurihalina]
MQLKAKTKTYSLTTTSFYVISAYLIFQILGFLQSLFIGLMIAAGTAWIQHRGWENQEKIKTLDSEKKKAYDLIEQISEVVGKRIYHQSTLITALQKHDDSYNRDPYESSVKEINEEYYKICMGLKYSFSNEVMLNYEKRFQNRLANNNRKIFSASCSLNLTSAHSELKEINWELNKFVDTLLKKVRRNEFSTFTNKNPTTNFENREKFTTIYLALRLINIRH